MRTANFPQDQNELMIPENAQVGFQNAQNEHHKPFLASTIHKTVPIGYQFHQVIVNDFIPSNCSDLRKVLPEPCSQPVYLRRKVQLQELEQFLSFVENFYQEKIPDYFT